MINIQRGLPPEFFNSPKFEKAKLNLEARFLDSERQERIRFDDKIIRQIRDSLMDVFKGKCAYCETKVGVSDPGTFDPFRPRNGARGLEKGQYAPQHYWWLFYEWDNMMLSCSICNQKYKRDFFPIMNESMRAEEGTKGNALLLEGALLIDPCSNDPEEHLLFTSDGMVSSITTKGQVTIDVLGLNRLPLLNERRQAAEHLLKNLEMLQELPATDRKSAQQHAYIAELFMNGSPHEYAALQRAVFSSWYLKNSSIWEKIKDQIDRTEHMKLTPHHQKSITDSELEAISHSISSIKRFSIKSFSIHNFKSIDRLELDILPADTRNDGRQRESWLLALGDNGIGKSSILQALALTLCGERQLKKLDLDPTDFLKRGQESGSVTVHSHEHDQPVTLQFNSDGFTSSIIEPATYLMGYGSTRLLPKKSLMPDSDKEPYANIRNLFDYTVALEDPQAWLGSLDAGEFEERVVPAFYDVLALRGKDRLYRSEGKINIRHYNVDNELEETSDGYKTVVALVADIMQTLSGELSGYHNSTGIVLVDEIGNHLHPRWRVKIVGALRSAFPNLQFIVTTHEPLCLRGLSHGEVVVMVRDAVGGVRCLDSKLLPDHSAMRVEQLLTSDLFGLIDVMDADVEKCFEEYYALLSRGTDAINPAERKKIEALRTELKGKELLGNSMREQILFEAIDATLSQKMGEGLFKPQEILKKETVNLIKGLIEDNYKDIL